MFCTNCGAQNDDSSRFCKNCGTNLQPTAVSATAAHVAEPYVSAPYSDASAATPVSAPYGTTPAAAPFGAAPVSAPAAAATKKRFLVKILVPIVIIAVVVVAAIVFIVPQFFGENQTNAGSEPAPEPSKVSYTLMQNGSSVGPVEFAKEGNELVVTTEDGNSSSTVRLTKEGTMDGGTIYSWAASESSSTSSSYSTKYLIPDGFFRGDLKGKWIAYTQYRSSGYTTGYAYGFDIKNDGTGTGYSISSMSKFPTSFSVMQSVENSEYVTWIEKDGKWTFSMDGSTLVVEKE